MPLSKSEFKVRLKSMMPDVCVLCIKQQV
uniref:Uncharacterized protein n=1 Tax=Anguilla anguilla TaxID=7936 RepID=A0A0E9TFF6_ANGAN